MSDFNDDGTPAKMDAAAKEAWLAALESGEHDQATNKLYRRETGGFCCLGVFAKLQGCRFEPVFRDTVNSAGQTIKVELDDVIKVLDIAGNDANESEMLLQRYAAQFGISDFAQSVLSRLNDGTTTTIYDSDRWFTQKLAFWRQLELSQPETVNEKGTVTFHPTQHGFAEIAAVIRKHF